jgi:transcriptional regulator with XRE-family HTH domain
MVKEEMTIGEELTRIRKNKNLGLKDIAKEVGVSTMYISEIFRDKKTPSDEVIVKLANLFNYDEQKLFERFGRITEKVKEEITENEHLFNTLYSISKNGKLTKEQKQRLYEQLHQLYKELEDEEM